MGFFRVIILQIGEKPQAARVVWIATRRTEIRVALTAVVKAVTRVEAIRINTHIGRVGRGKRGGRIGVGLILLARFLLL